VCFYYNGPLFECKETGIPFIEHAKFFPDCPYIGYVKGHAFIRDLHSELD